MHIWTVLFYRYFHVNPIPSASDRSNEFLYKSFVAAVLTTHSLICTQVYLAVQETVYCLDQILFQVYFVKCTNAKQAPFKTVRLLFETRVVNIPMLQLNVSVYFVYCLIIFGIFAVTIHSAYQNIIS